MNVRRLICVALGQHPWKPQDGGAERGRHVVDIVCGRCFSPTITNLDLTEIPDDA